MSPKIDLHTHSAVSDGTQTPEELMADAAASGLDVVGLTDHDTVAGWDAAAAAARGLGIALVPGMEISCRYEGITVHLLSYLHDPADAALGDEVGRARDSRIVRARTMVERLSADYDLDWETVSAQVGPGATVGRPHLADALVSIGAVADRSEAFEHILTTRSPYYVSLASVNPLAAIRLVREAGGVPVFAHPLASKRGRTVGEETMELMIDAGLAGFEVDHRDHPEPARKRLREIARAHDLLITGSSDYHGAGKPNKLGENVTDPEMFARIEAQATGHPVVR